MDARLGLDPRVRQLFDLLRRTGNAAAHEAAHGIGFREGLEALKVAREIAVWFHRTFGRNQGFKPGPFVLPDDPSQKLVQLQQQIAQLSTALQDAQSAQAHQAEMATLLAAQAEQEREMARRAQEESAVYQELAEEAGQRAAALQAQFESQLQSPAHQANSEEITQFAQRANTAAKAVLLDEAATRQIIDLQLRDAGWEANTTELTHAKGARPQRGKNKAIAEWPTAGQQAADYLLFAGLTPIATVEAKRMNVNVPGKIGQAERYARGFATLFMNRTNRSGILKGGVIGGKAQAGAYHLDARFKREVLVGRLRRIADRAGGIHVHCRDALDLLQHASELMPAKSLIYLDPPYYVKGSGLYRNFYQHDDHLAIARLLRKRGFGRRWVVSYDNAAQIRDMYSGVRSIEYGLGYTAQRRYTGSEVMLFDPLLDLGDFLVDREAA